MPLVGVMPHLVRPAAIEELPRHRRRIVLCPVLPQTVVRGAVGGHSVPSPSKPARQGITVVGVTHERAAKSAFCGSKISCLCIMLASGDGM